MRDPIEFCYHLTEPYLVVIARYGREPAWRIGSVNGSLGEDGIGFLSDINVDDEIEVKGGFLGLWKRKVPLRGKGIGSELLERFEHELGKLGVKEIRGNLVPETPDKLEWLISWYRKRGYEFHPGQTAGDWAPHDTSGVVCKRLKLPDPSESNAMVGR